MRVIVALLIFLCSFYNSEAQNLFPENYDDCKIGNFELEGGDIKSVFKEDLTTYFSRVLTKEQLHKVQGVVLVQILIDTKGNPCVRSINYTDCKNISKVDLRNIINNMGGWVPATKANSPINVSITIKFDFNAQPPIASYFHYNPLEGNNLRSPGKINIENHNENYVKNKTVKKIEVFDKQNSKIPWDMSRAISVDTNNVIWYGTDDGIVKIANGEMTLLNSRNSPLRPMKKINRTMIMNSAVDIYNNKWFSDGPNTYEFDGKNWKVYDGQNSHLSSVTGIYPDKNGNVWFKTPQSAAKFDGESWSFITPQNSKLISGNISGIFVDKKNRIWIGSYNGNNIMIDADSTVDFQYSKTPLKNATILKGYEDNKGNIWFSLHSKKNEDRGLAKLSIDNHWQVYNTSNSGIPANTIEDFVIDEERNTIWVSVNGVGMSNFDGKQWSIFTPENSNVPSTYIQEIAFDKDGNLWCATFAGLAEIIFKK